MLVQNLVGGELLMGLGSRPRSVTAHVPMTQGASGRTADCLSPISPPHSCAHSLFSLLLLCVFVQGDMFTFFMQLLQL